MTRKYMSLTEFVKLGFVQEINRQFLHPRGLALEYIIDEDGRVEDDPLRIWDCRDDPEGIYFDETLIDDNRREYVNSLLFDKQKTRLQNLGYIVQPGKSLREAREEGSAI
jgi:hypothetical protein